MDPPAASSRPKQTTVNPYKKRSKQGEFNHEDTANPKKGNSLPEYVGYKREYMSTTPSPKKSNSISDHAAVVTNSSIIHSHSDEKTYSKQYNKPFQQSNIIESIKVNTKLDFDEKSTSKASKKAATISKETSTTTSTYSSPRFTKQPTNIKYKSSTKSSSQQCNEPKLEPYEIQWTDSEQLRNEAIKYDVPENIVLTQEYIIPLILNASTTAMIKIALCLLIGKNGALATDVFMPLPSQRVKLIENFLVLIYDTKSMMVNNIKQEYR